MYSGALLQFSFAFPWWHDRDHLFICMFSTYISLVEWLWSLAPFFWLNCFLIVESESEVTQSWPTLCDPMDCSLRGSSVHGIFKARVLEWVAISFSRGSSQPRDQTQVSCIASRCFTVWATEFPAFFVYLDNSLLSYVSIANIFSQSVFYLLILLILSFIEQKSESLIKSSLSIISFIDHAFDLHI